MYTFLGLNFFNKTPKEGSVWALVRSGPFHKGIVKVLGVKNGMVSISNMGGIHVPNYKNAPTAILVSDFVSLYKELK